ncbi:hypothetical protein [Nocardioides aestuarii]|uniref:Type IV toxin-antitoxin system AbiEi family antitoxin domain-containing protein n=1 Tax=Nocardioides aestuarii TaxID=252231 RepID=A0ABW4TRY6_9ACTN
MHVEPEILNAAVTLRREYLAEGITDAQIRRLVRRRQITRIRHGSYVQTALWESLSREDRHRLLIRAVLKRGHPSMVITHVSAAVERGCSIWGVALDDVDVTRVDGRAGRSEAGVRHHAGSFTDEEIEVVNGVALSVAPRTVVEVTTRCDVESSLVLVNQLLHNGQLDKRQLRNAAEYFKYWPGTLTTTLVERLANPRLTSVAESRTWYLCWAQHLPCPEPQVAVHDENGVVVAYADFAWRQHGVFLEFDGRIKYERYRRKGETLEDYLMREKRREELICLLTGWVCIRIQWADLAHPERTAARIQRILDSRRSPIPA